MKIFISWSGKRSRAVAEIISDWLKCVLQASQPWVSSRDIDRGAIWFSEINDKLRDVSVGIVCLTLENKEKPWILFETGALAKGLSTNRVCTFLIDLKPEDLHDPLAQFNHTMPTPEGLWDLLVTINSCLADKSLDERILKTVFETYLNKFMTDFNYALSSNPANEVIEPRSEQDILSEILANTRNLTQRVRNLESELPKNSVFRESQGSSPLHTINRVKNDIRKMIEFSERSDEEILDYGMQYGLPESFMLQLMAERVTRKI